MSIQWALITQGARSALLSFLQTNFNSCLSDPDIQGSGPLVINKIESDAFYISPRYESLKIPALLIDFTKFSFVYDGNPNALIGQHSVTTTITVEELEADRLQEKVEIYARALFKCLDQQSIVDTQSRIQLKMVSDAIEYGEYWIKGMPHGKQVFRRDVSYTWKALHFENRTISS